MDISVIIPSYKSKDYILSCLESLHRQKTNARYEIIVVDSSPEDISFLIKQAFPYVKVIHLKEQTFPGVARNIGFRESKGEILAFIDVDCVVDEYWIEKIITSHTDTVKVVAGSIVNGRPFSIPGQAEYFLVFREFSPFAKKKETNMLVTANFSIRRVLFNQLEGFSDLRASEDVLFALSVTEAGEKIFFYPDLKIFHMKKINLKSFFNNQFLLGTASAIARKQKPNLPGAFLSKTCFLPLLPLVRILRTLGFLARYSTKGLLISCFILTWAFPVLFLGACTWTAGFARGLQKDGSVFSE